MSLPANKKELLIPVIGSDSNIVRNISFEIFKLTPTKINIALLGAGSGKTAFLKSLLGKNLARFIITLMRLILVIGMK